MFLFKSRTATAKVVRRGAEGLAGEEVRAALRSSVHSARPEPTARVLGGSRGAPPRKTPAACELCCQHLGGRPRGLPLSAPLPAATGLPRAPQLPAAGCAGPRPGGGGPCEWLSHSLVAGMLLPLGGTPGAMGEGSRGKLLGLAGLHPGLLSLALTNSM